MRAGFPAAFLPPPLAPFPGLGPLAPPLPPEDPGAARNLRPSPGGRPGSRLRCGWAGAEAGDCSGAFEGDLELDLGNLMAYSPAEVDPAALARDPEAHVAGLAQGMAQALVGRVFELPTTAAPVGRLAALPRPTTQVPRYQRLPSVRKAKTKWQQFAEEKGIQKRKRSKLVWDEREQDWKRRHGYGKANDIADTPVIEGKASDVLGEDPFTKARQDKKERVAKNAAQQLQNSQRASGGVRGAGRTGGGKGKGGDLPATLALSSGHINAGYDKSYLLEGRPGAPAARKAPKADIKRATQAAAASTASMGKFDARARGEKDISKRGRKQQRLENVAAGGKMSDKEVGATKEVIRKLLKTQGEPAINARKAMGQQQVAMERERRSAKARGGAGGGKGRAKGRR